MINEHLSWAHPLVRDWFLGRFGTPTEPQELGWPSILAGKTTLISAPTGSGKTFAAFLACLEGLVRQALQGDLPNRTEVLYVSPLKALSNDIQKNLMGPLEEISALARERGLEMMDIRVMVRTGDTPTRERQAMLKQPPHILVTTPESLYILLTAEKSRAMLMNVSTVIVDEIHAMVNDKRGAHLALSLERLQALTFAPPVRIGLSATQKPLEKVANFLAGNGRPQPVIVNIGHTRHLDLAIEIPSSELGAVTSNVMWDEIYDRITELAAQNRATLVFVNTRRLAERVAHNLSQRLGEQQVAAHHGSLSRKLRLAAETRLKNGELTVLVATASLELGIDIGTVDLVCQIGSTRAIAVALQRIGRAGHWRGAIPKGRIFATTRDELLECAALVYAIRCGDLDHLIMPEQPLDILAQQIVATCATADWREDDLFKLITHAYSYAGLSREIFNSVLEMLSEGIAGSRGRYGAYLFRDGVNGIVRARRGSRLTAITSGGAIPENGLFTVIAEPEGMMVGTVDEDFAVESSRGDIILLGTASWRISRVESSGRMIVEDAHGAPPSVPFWRGEAPARTAELSLHVANLRQKLSDMLPDLATATATAAAVNWLISACSVDVTAAQQLIKYILQGRALLGAVPTQSTIIAERFFDESGGMQLIIHAPFGARINKAWGLALRKRFCRSFNFELQAAATDNGLNISLAEQHSFPLADVFQFLHPQTLREVLTQAVLQAPLFTTRWRWDAMRSLALVRFRNGKKVPPNILRMRSDDLLAAVFPDAAACQDNLGGRDIELPDHPLINEAMKDVLTEALDVDGLIAVLNHIISGEIRCIAIDTPTPSTFAHEILNANPYAFLDDAPLEERRARAVEMRRVLPDSLLQNMGRLDATAIAQVQEQAWPEIRDENELHDAMQTLIAFPQQEIFREYFNILAADKRALAVSIGEQVFWRAAEKASIFTAIYCRAEFDSLVIMLRGWLLHSGPVTAEELSVKLALNPADVNLALLKLETTGLILRGHFLNGESAPLEWCERGLLARIHRLTLGRLRKEIEPVTAAQFMRWLLTWQHVAPGAQLRGEAGVLEILRQLQGFEIPANAWERQILAKRVADYDPQALDRLCLAGIIGWGRLSPHPAEKNGRAVMPTAVAPITFFVREEADWLPDNHHSLQQENMSGLSQVAKNIHVYLQQKGASFFADIFRGNGQLKSAVESGLWELVAAGVVTADGFDNLRALIDPRRRSGKSGQHARARYSGGRWSLLHNDENRDPQRRIEALCRILLKRYGVVFRELLSREMPMPPWRELLVAFRRLENQGEIRGGRFVSGFLGEQFALPYAVDSLRSMKKTAAFSDVPVVVAAVDPLNLAGILWPGERVTAISGKAFQLSFSGETPVSTELCII
jgi:ATP-dependent helicase Lhr and Lhr-like helicase